MKRQCGQCNECCTVMAVTEIDKPVMTRCEKLVAFNGKGCCSIYQDRPGGCKTFKCGWLMGGFKQKHRPDRSGIVAWSDNDGKKIVMAESKLGAMSRSHALEMQRIAHKKGISVVPIAYGFLPTIVEKQKS